MTLGLRKRLPLLLLLLAVLAGSGCNTIKNMWKNDDRNEGVPVEQLYDDAHGYMRKERWTSASEVFQRLIAQYPYGPYTEQALM